MAVAILVAAACASGSEGEQAPAPTPEDGAASVPDPTATPAVEETEFVVADPTAAAEPIELSDEEMIEAALAAFEANPEPETLIAWDHLEARVSGSEVTLTMCTWTGDTVFDDIRAANYIVTPDTNGDPKTRFNFSNGLLGQECLNTELIESALAFTREYDIYWEGVLADPATFDPEVAAEYKTAERVVDNQVAVDGWVRDGLHWKGPVLDGELPESAVRDLLGRSFTFAEFELFELVACRDMDESFGLYQGEVLIDDSRGELSGSNSIVKYQLQREAGSWELAGVFSNVWANCVDPDGWLGWVNEWQPEPPTQWEIVVKHG